MVASDRIGGNKKPDSDGDSATIYSYASGCVAEVDDLYRKILWRIVPLLFICYVVNFLDRLNVSYAKLGFSKDTGITTAEYGLGAGLFYLGYVLFEIPSNLILEKVGARKTILRIMVLWGMVSAGTAFVNNATEFYAVRLLLGVAEAGFFPGMILYLTYWFPAVRRGRITSIFMSAVMLSGVLGGPISGAIMYNLDDVLGLRGWQWMFLLEGLPALLLGVVAYFYLDDKPGKARWLSPRELEIVNADLERDGGGGGGGRHVSFFRSLRDPRMLFVCFVYFAVISGTGGVTFWLPTIIKGTGIDNIWHVGLLSAIPFIGAFIGSIFMGYSSDRTMERRWHVAGAMLTAALGWALLPLFNDSTVFSVAVITVCAIGVFSAQPIFWTVVPTYLSRTAAAGGIALVSSIGGIGGFLGPTIIGSLTAWSGSLAFGMYYLAAILVAGAVVLLMGMPESLLRPSSGEALGKDPVSP